jgi:hypothetical protein
VIESQTPPVLADLSELEQSVVEAARRGVWTEPAFAVEVEELAVTEDPLLRVRAEVIRELLMGRRGELAPRGACGKRSGGWAAGSGLHHGGHRPVLGHLRAA